MPLLPKDFVNVRPLHERVSGFAFHPSPAEVGEAMAHHYLMGLMYSALAQAYASENRARMTAMDTATTNIDHLRTTYTLLKNRARQASITNELTEIVASKEAME